eukprot:SAG31_NODE_18094_length_647_cov_0.903285_1_plen_30_part_01
MTALGYVWVGGSESDTESITVTSDSTDSPI